MIFYGNNFDDVLGPALSYCFENNECDLNSLMSTTLLIHWDMRHSDHCALRVVHHDIHLYPAYSTSQRDLWALICPSVFLCVGFVRYQMLKKDVRLCPFRLDSLLFNCSVCRQKTALLNAVCCHWSCM